MTVDPEGVVTPDELQRQVEALVLLGVPPGEAARAVMEGRVAFAIVDQVLAEGRRHTLSNMADAAGLPEEVLHRGEALLGTAGLAGLRAEDIDEAARLRRLLDVISVEQLLKLARADGQALNRLVLAHMQMVEEEFVAPVREAGGDDVAVAVALGEAARTLLPIGPALVGSTYRRILEHALSTELVAAVTRTPGPQVALAVGFVDVVGYTSLSARIEPSGLDEVVEAFETRCVTVAGLDERVQLVKFIGDAAMFAALDPVPLIDALLMIVEPVDEDSPLAGTPIRGGVAAGEVLSRGGDYFGGPVNLAARLTDRAKSNRLLVDDELEERLAPVFELRRTGSMRLRGIGTKRPLSLRPDARLSE